MESRKIVLGNLLVGRNRGKDIEDRLADIAGKGVGGTNQESSTEAYTLPCAKELVGCRCVIHGAQLCVLERWDEGWRWEGSSREKGYMCIYYIYG